MLLPHKTTRLMCLQPTQAAERLFHCFSHQIFQQIAVGLLHFFHLFWMIMNLKILQHLLPSSPLPLHLFSTLNNFCSNGGNEVTLWQCRNPGVAASMRQCQSERLCSYKSNNLCRWNACTITLRCWHYYWTLICGSGDLQKGNTASTHLMKWTLCLC